MKININRNAETLRQIFSGTDKIDDSVPPVSPISPTPSKFPKREEENNKDKKKEDKPKKSFADYLEDELNKNRTNSSWIIDKRGNRITDEQAAEIVRRNRSEIEDLENRMRGRSKADNLRDGSWLRWHDLKAANDYYESMLKHIEHVEGRKIMNNRKIKSGYERNADSVRKIFSSDNNSDENNAFLRGYDDYFNGNRKNPYKYGTVEYWDWWEGYQEAITDFED